MPLALHLKPRYNRLTLDIMNRRLTPEKLLQRTRLSVIARAARLARVDHQTPQTTCHGAKPGVRTGAITARL
jgi:hypothetical protein